MLIKPLSVTRRPSYVTMEITTHSSPEGLWKKLYTFDDSVKFLCDRIFLYLLTRSRSGNDHLIVDQAPEIYAGPFTKTAISHHKDLVSKYFQQYPVLYINLKVIWLVSVLKGFQT